MPVFGRCACCCWGTLFATRRCLGDCSRGPRADSQRQKQSNAAQRELSTAKQRPSTARLQSFYFAARLAAAPGVQASRAGSVRLPHSRWRSASSREEQRACTAGSGVCELNLHSTTRRTPISGDTAVQGLALCCGAGVHRAFRGGATSEVASAAISVINQRALRPPPTETAPARRHNDFR